MAKNLIDWITSQVDQNPEKDGIQLVSPQMKQNANNAVTGIKSLFSDAGQNIVRIAKGNVGDQGYTPSLPLRAAAATQRAFQPTINYLEKPATFADTMAQSPNIAAKIMSVPAGIAQGLVNTPQSIYRGGKSLATDVGGIATGNAPTPQAVIAHGMPLLEGLTNLLGIGSTAGVAANLGEQGFKQALISGAKTGAGFGAATGAMQGLRAGENASSVPSQVAGAIPSVIQGGLTGAVVGGALSGLGWKIGDLVDQRTQRINLDKVNQMLDEYHAQEKLGNLSPEEVKNLKVVNQMLDQYKTSEAKMVGPALPKEPIGSVPLNKYQSAVLEPQRYFKKVLGDGYEAFKQQVFEPLSQAKGGMADWKNSANARVEKMGFKAGTKESAAIQKYGEGKIGIEQLTTEFGDVTAKRIVNAANTFRAIYNETRDFANARRVAAGLQEIPFKQDYFRHTGDSPSFLNSFTGSGERSASIMKKSGETVKFDAVKGFSSYIEKAGQAAFIDPLVPQFEKVSKDLAKQGAHPAITDYLDNWITHQIQGVTKTPTSNETVNQAIGLGDKLIGNVKKNQILGNVSSVVNQVGNVPLALNDVATAPGGAVDVIKGTMNVVKNFAEVAKSNFFKDRNYSQPGSFESSLLRRGQNFIGTPIEAADSIFSKYIASLYYEQGLRLGVKDPINYAGDMTQAAVGGRGIGDRSAMQASKLGTTLVPFSLEVQNNINKIAELAGDKRYGALVGLAFTNWGLNKVMENITGSKPFIDPIGAAIESYNQLTGQNGKQADKTKSVGILVNEALKFSPIAQDIIAGIYPIAQGLTADEQGNSPIPKSKDIFGSEDPTRFGSVSMYIPQGIKDTILKYNPIGGGNQAKKTFEGIQAGNNGYTTNKYGNVTSPASQDPVSRAKMALFGQWDNPKSQDFFAQDGSKGLSKKQSDVYRTMAPDQRDAYFKMVQDSSKAKAAQNPDILTKLFGGGGESAPTDVTKMTKAQKQAQLTIINEKAANGMDLTPEDVQIKYLDKYSSMPEKTTYEKSVKFSEGLKQAKAVFGDQYASDATKKAILDKTGISPQEVQYNQVASGNDTDQAQFIQEQLANLDPKARDAFLLMGRSMVGNTQLVSDNVIGKLEDAGVVSKEEGNALKRVSYIRDNEYTGKDAIKIGTSTYKPVIGKTSGAVSKIKVTAESLGAKKGRRLTSPKIKISSPGAATIKAFKISTPKLQSGKNWRSIKLKA